jgi:hypothetical protein
MDSGVVIYVRSFIKIGSGIQKLIGGGYTDTHTRTGTWSHKPTLFFQNKESRLKMKFHLRSESWFHHCPILLPPSDVCNCPDRQHVIVWRQSYAGRRLSVCSTWTRLDIMVPTRGRQIQSASKCLPGAWIFKFSSKFFFNISSSLIEINYF